MNQAIHNRLVRLAQSRQTASFEEIASLSGLQVRGSSLQNRIGKMLKEISVYEHSHARPMLSALVHDKGNRSPGPEFFALARALGKYSGEDERADRRFLEDEINSVWKQWGRTV